MLSLFTKRLVIQTGVRLVGVRPFSTETQVKEEKRSEEEIEDEIFKFEQQWETIAREKMNKQSAFVSEYLSDMQKERTEMLANKFMELNVFEMQYVQKLINQRFKQLTTLDLVNLNTNWPTIKETTEGVWPLADPNWYKRQGIAQRFGPFIKSMGDLGGAAPQKTQTASSQGAQDSAPKEEVPSKAKANLDVELSGYDPAKKIKVIKEVRQIFKLGLKQAKELVESAPCWIMKQGKREDAEELHKKLTEVGAEIKLV